MEEQQNINFNGTMMQYFEWYLPDDCTLWNKVAAEAEHLKNIGITAVWLPPAYKGSGGKSDVGYGSYDLYDLGEFDQKGTIATKYGTKDEYIKAINTLKYNDIQVYADIVLDHKLGADECEDVIAEEIDPNNRMSPPSEPKTISAWTKYTFPGRSDKYSNFKWNWKHFHGTDWNEKEKRKGLFKFYGKDWDKEVDKENGNFDYLMGNDLDLNNVEVVEELEAWGRWYLSLTNIDGFRIDAAKHIRSSFFTDWLRYLKEETGRNLFVVGEYWNYDVGILNNYIDKTEGCMSLFDVPLHYNFYAASNSNGCYDMRTLLNNTLTAFNCSKSVTFVDNHDTQEGQALQSNVLSWFKPLAYAFILLRKDGYPCVFYGDYYGIPSHNVEPLKNTLDILINARKKLAYGKQNDYFDDMHIIGWTREGDNEHPGSGLAVLMTDNDGGSKRMYVGEKFSGMTFYDCTGNIQNHIIIDSDGSAEFFVNGGSVSVWIRK